MSLHMFKGGQYDITMADSATAQLIAATNGISLAYGQANDSSVSMQSVGNAQDRGIDGIATR